MISASMCERRSRVTGSMVWYSSSMPMVKLGRIGLQKCHPPQFLRLHRLARDLYRVIRPRLHDPVEVLLAHRIAIGIRRGIQEIDRIRDAVFHRELHCVEVIAQRAAERDAIAFDASLHRPIEWR